jgi:hypothetical protein
MARSDKNIDPAVLTMRQQNTGLIPFSSTLVAGQIGMLDAESSQLTGRQQILEAPNMQTNFIDLLHDAFFIALLHDAFFITLLHDAFFIAAAPQRQLLYGTNAHKDQRHFDSP